jgi:predicted amino acid racemase
MGEYPKLLIDLEKLKKNVSTIVQLSNKHNISITGVTKATCGDPEVARVMLENGIQNLGDSRVENIIHLKEQGVRAEYVLLRTPMLSNVADVVEYVDVSLNTEPELLKALSREAILRRKVHCVILMVEMGDLREGIPPQDFKTVLKYALNLKGIEVVGIGMNLACYGGVVPTKKKIQQFLDVVNDVEEEIGFCFRIISGGNSANIPRLLKNEDHKKINNLRVGEGILLGRETVNRTPIPNTYQDVFTLEAEIIELKSKPSIPYGDTSQNAWGEIPKFEDRGEITRAIVGVGKQDAVVTDLIPFDPNVEILGSSSDHIILHLKDSGYNVGDVIRFIPKYGALVHLYTSKYVNKLHIT